MKYNDFEQWFPGGMKRKLYERINETRKEYRLITDLDEIRSEQSFDMETFNEYSNNIKSTFRELREIYRSAKGRDLSEEEEIKEGELEKLSQESREKLDNLLEPVYNKMLELGYTSEELT